MDIHELVLEMKVLERRLMLYEEKYGILSEDFYAALMAGKFASYDAYDETRTDFSQWKGPEWQEAVIEIITKPPVNQILRVSSYTPSMAEVVPIISVEKPPIPLAV